MGQGGGWRTAVASCVGEGGIRFVHWIRSSRHWNNVCPRRSYPVVDRVSSARFRDHWWCGIRIAELLSGLTDLNNVRGGVGVRSLNKVHTSLHWDDGRSWRARASAGQLGRRPFFVPHCTLGCWWVCVDAEVWWAGCECALTSGAPDGAARAQRLRVKGLRMGLGNPAPRSIPVISWQVFVRIYDCIAVRSISSSFQSDLMMRGSSESPTTRSRISRRAQKAADGMKKLMQVPFALASMERKWLSPLVATASLSIVLLLVGIFTLGSTGHRPLLGFSRTDLAQSVHAITEEGSLAGLPRPPKLAYLISGTIGDGPQMQRTLQALYHPHNYYLLHLDREAPESERGDLDQYLRSEPVFQEAQNVFVVGKANLVTYKGPTMIAATLHGAAILLHKAKDWDWFINLSASDYPLITQDDLLHVFSYLPKDLNFIEHTSDIVTWKEDQRVKPIIIDPGLYQVEKSDIFWMTQRRAVPDAFRLFTGSAWVALTRSFMDYCNAGWDNLPRTVLMYYANFVSSPEGYFHTVLCNSEEFRNTTVNHDLHFIAWDNPPKQHPLSLTLDFFHALSTSGAAFARKFAKDDPVLDKIDQELLRRPKNKFSPGGWCVGSSDDPCAVRGDYSLLRPGPGAQRFEDLVVRLLSPDNFRTQQCIAV